MSDIPSMLFEVHKSTDDFFDVSRQVGNIFTSAQDAITSINQGRESMDAISKKIYKEAIATMAAYLGQLKPELKRLRKARKGQNITRADFLDPDTIWGGKYGNPIWGFLLQSKGPFPNAPSSDKTYGIITKEMQKFMSGPPLRLTPEDLVSISGYGFAYALSDTNYVHRFDYRWIPDIRSFDRSLFACELLPADEVAFLQELISDPLSGTRIEPLL